jgi:cytoskeletal protein CcmA (bactofilin family)
MKKERKVDSISTFLGSDASIEGNIQFQGTIRLDGKVEGAISSKGGTVIVGEKAVVNADISVGMAIIMGEVNGTVIAKDRLEVYPPGRIVGDIQSPVISIEAGGKFNGNCSMKVPELPGIEGRDDATKVPKLNAPKTEKKVTKNL